MPAGHEARDSVERATALLIENISAACFPNNFPSNWLHEEGSPAMKLVKENCHRYHRSDLHTNLDFPVHLLSPSSTYDEVARQHVLPPIRSCCVPPFIEFPRWRRGNSISSTSISVQIIKHSTTWSITGKFSQQNAPIIARRGEPKKGSCL